MNGILTLLFLTFFVVLHEYGHYISARRSKIAVSEFFVGFGPKIFSFKRGNTEYGLKAIPLGGYVKIPGMDESEDTTGYESTEVFHNAKWTTKFYIAISGILVNFLTAWLILFAILSTNGVNVPTLEISNTGTSVEGNITAPSVSAGLLPGDKIVSFSEIPVASWDELVTIIEENPGKEVTITFLRNGNLLDSKTVLESRTLNNQKVGYLGVTPTIENEKIGLISAFKSTTILEAQMTIAAVDGIITLFSPENIKTLLGTYTGQEVPDEVRPLSPIGLARAGSQIAEESYINLFSLLAFVNIFLAVFNALPFIPLDGGRVVLALIEGVTGKKVSDKKLYPIAALVVGIFIFLGITAFYLDITQPIQL
jgi:membrane-associated protease RseP (regulator of RpoE activity)|tara:strand:+ start:6070 stop:7170 length:1101 start_codon:yes stop_codon:yes gene_type:complete